MFRLVAPAMSGWRRIVSPVLATAALGYLVAMVLTGAQPILRQIVPFEANGVLKTLPMRIERVELSRGAERISLVRTGEKTWATLEGRDVGAEAGNRISMAVQMMHTSGPAREIPPEELANVDVAAFELDPPQIVARLYARGDNPILTARFGGRNPDGFLQYMQIDGDPRVYLMSRFVGEQWREALNGTKHR
jgi:hypothetical protein